MDPSATTHGGPAACRQLTEDECLSTASGATFTALRGWWVTFVGDVIVLEDPDRQVRDTWIETPEPDAEAAVRAAWERARPGLVLRPEGEPVSPPPIRGWERTIHFGYERQLGERTVRGAMARRFGGRTYVSVLEADQAALARREAQLTVAQWTLKPLGMREESFAGVTPHVLDDARAAELDAFLERGRSLLDIPGIAVAVLQGGRVAYERALGVRALGEPAPVTPGTRFLIGSITKPMTTLLHASLVDTGHLRWDTPVVDLLPDFALGDPELTGRLTLELTSSASTGMPRRDLELIFRFLDVTLEQRLASMRTMKPTTGLGEAFQYSNLMLVVGGCAAARALAPSVPLAEAYARAMQERVFGPVGMTSTTLDFEEAAAGDHAAPHSMRLDGVTRPHAVSLERQVVSVAPAGGVWSTLRDMNRYALTELSGGVAPGGRRVASEENLRERRRMRVRIGDADGYGLGLGTGTFRDLPYVGHNGGTPGFASLMWLLPEQGIGVVCLANTSEGHGLHELLVRKVVELLFDGARDLAEPRFELQVRARRESVARAAKGIQRSPELVGPLVARLAGRYANPDLGEAWLRAEGDGGTFDVGDWASTVARIEDNAGAECLVLCDPPALGLNLVVGGDRAHPTLTIHDAQLSYVFERLDP